MLLFTCGVFSCATSDSLVQGESTAVAPVESHKEPTDDEPEEHIGEGFPADDAESGFSGVESLSASQAAIIETKIDEYVYLAVADTTNPDGLERVRMIVEAANAAIEGDGYHSVTWEQSYPLINRSVRDSLEGTTALRRMGSILNADVCLDIKVGIVREGAVGAANFKAEVTVSGVDTLTGDDLGEIQHIGGAYGTEADAVRETVKTAVRKTIHTIRSRAFRELARGIRYELVIQNTSDSGLMDFFAEELEKRVLSIVSRSYSKAETRYTLQMIGRASDVEDVVYDIAGKIPGLKNMSLVFQQGNSFTFASGI